jgi:hypothetical protein
MNPKNFVKNHVSKLVLAYAKSSGMQPRIKSDRVVYMFFVIYFHSNVHVYFEVC